MSQKTYNRPFTESQVNGTQPANQYHYIIYPLVTGYKWARYLSDGSTKLQFVDHVYDTNSGAYPNGGVKNGYYYERVATQDNLIPDIDNPCGYSHRSEPIEIPYYTQSVTEYNFSTYPNESFPPNSEFNDFSISTSIGAKYGGTTVNKGGAYIGGINGKMSLIRLQYNGSLSKWSYTLNDDYYDSTIDQDNPMTRFTSLCYLSGCDTGEYFTHLSLVLGYISDTNTYELGIIEICAGRIPNVNSYTPLKTGITIGMLNTYKSILSNLGWIDSNGRYRFDLASGVYGTGKSRFYVWFFNEFWYTLSKASSYHASTWIAGAAKDNDVIITSILVAKNVYLVSYLQRNGSLIDSYDFITSNYSLTNLNQINHRSSVSGQKILFSGMIGCYDSSVSDTFFTVTNANIFYTNNVNEISVYVGGYKYTTSGSTVASSELLAEFPSYKLKGYGGISVDCGGSYQSQAYIIGQDFSTNEAVAHYYYIDTSKVSEYKFYPRVANEALLYNETVIGFYPYGGSPRLRPSKFQYMYISLNSNDKLRIVSRYEREYDEKIVLGDENEMYYSSKSIVAFSPIEGEDVINDVQTQYCIKKIDDLKKYQFDIDKNTYIPKRNIHSSF